MTASGFGSRALTRLAQGAAAVALATTLAAVAQAAPVTVAGRQMEALDRGIVAVPATGGGGILVSWRLLAGDAKNTSFNVYRDGAKVNARPLTAATNLVDTAGTPASRYSVRAVTGGREARDDGRSAAVWASGYLTLPLQKPADGTTPDGQSYTYGANDASVGDLDGDGSYEIVVKWDPSNGRDNSAPGYTGNVYFDAYKLDGTRLWRIDLGRNIRAGAHYSQFLVYDFDGDGKAEMAVKTADGTTDAQGKVIGDANADWRGKDGEVPQADRTGARTTPDGRRVAPLTGRIMEGPEFLTVFDGPTGRALATAPYDPPRYAGGKGTTEQLTETWGDGYANRSDRFLAGVAYLDGKRPSIVMARGYYAKTTLAAWDFRDGKLAKRWLFDSATLDDPKYGGQGNHQLSVADVDGDGRDEIVYGSMAIDDNGKPLWSANLFHGDAMHVGDLDPTRPGLERFGVHESPGKNGGIGSAMLDAKTGERLWTTPSDNDTGRGIAMDVDPRHYGVEAWNSASRELYDVKGQVIPGGRPRQQNFAIWWDGDRLRELLDRNQISKWDWTKAEATPLLTAEGATSNNGTKANPALSGDILGDWREELVLRTDDSSALRIYATPYPTEERIVTLMHDPLYRLSIAWQNVAYNQPPHTSFYLGAPAPGR